MDPVDPVTLRMYHLMWYSSICMYITSLRSTPVLLPRVWYRYCAHPHVYTAKASWYSRTANLVDVLHLVDGMYHPYYTDLLRTPPGVHSQGILVLAYRQV